MRPALMTAERQEEEREEGELDLSTLENGRRNNYFSTQASLLVGAHQDQVTVRRSPLILAGTRQGQTI